ncbi:MAG: threonylcarbamoyl-AMP synthase [Beijerinckiaceae bacterium]|nr:threonylcarbamoyl-AMP synthase [Beijerinckiaceae bacterium]
MTRRMTAGPEAIAQAALVLRAGGLVAFPTETVYGLGADSTQDAAVAGIYSAKARPSFNPLIAHVADADAAQALAVFDADALALARVFWPGPLTIVAPALAGCPVSLLARAGLDSVAIRVPAHPVASAILREAAIPIAAPSANRSGRVSPTSADHVAGDLDGRIDLIVDGGPCAVGVESTIVSCLGDGVRILRPGGVSREDIERVLGRAVEQAVQDADEGSAPIAPGMLASHYAPRARVRLDATNAAPGEAVLDFGGQLTGAPGARLDLSPGGDLAEAAANLFAFLRRLDDSGAGAIAVAPIPPHGLGAAINDRLARAAAPRRS